MLHPLRRSGDRSYWVWLKGQRNETQERVFGGTKADAVWKFSMRRNVKTIACDAKWIRW